MRVLMISTDKTLLGLRGIGDAVGRHRIYAASVERLDIAVLSRGKAADFQIAPNCRAFAVRAWQIFTRPAVAMRQARYDLVVCQDPFWTGIVGWFLKRWFSSKLIVHFHGDFWDNAYYAGSAMSRLKLNVSRAVVSAADGIRVVSGGIRDKLVAAGVPKGKIVILPTPVNFGIFTSPDPLATEDIRRRYGPRMILFIGRLVAEKNIPVLFESFKILRRSFADTRLVIAGDGPLLHDLENQAAAMQLSGAVHFAGLLPPVHLVNYLWASNVIVLPSATESFGKVLVEAAAARKPSVATRTTGAMDIIEEGVTGYLVPIDDPPALAEKISAVFSDSIRAREMGESAWKRVSERFDPARISEGIVDFWEKVMQHP